VRSLAAFRMVVHDRSSTAGALLGVVAIVFLVGQQLSVLFGLLNYMSVLVDHSNADARRLVRGGSRGRLPTPAAGRRPLGLRRSRRNGSLGFRVRDGRPAGLRQTGAADTGNGHGDRRPQGSRCRGHGRRPRVSGHAGLRPVGQGQRDRGHAARPLFGNPAAFQARNGFRYWPPVPSWSVSWGRSLRSARP